MPIDDLGCARATLLQTKRQCLFMKIYVKSLEFVTWWELIVGIFDHVLGMSCKCGSPTQAEYVPVLCTHRPSLLPIGCDVNVYGILKSG